MFYFVGIGIKSSWPGHTGHQLEECEAQMGQCGASQGLVAQ
jgi:hypothetical protein